MRFAKYLDHPKKSNHVLCLVATAKNTYRNRQDDFLVSSKVSNVAVQRDTLLGSSSLAHGQGDAQNGIGTKLG